MNIISKLIVVTTFAALAACATTQDHMAQGLIYANQNDFANAVNEFHAEVNARPSALAYANLGAAYMKQGKNNLALDAFKKGEDLDSRNTTLNYNITALYSILDKNDLALIYLDKALTNGFSNYDALRFDSDLSNLRAEPEFRTILEKHRIFLQ